MNHLSHVVRCFSYFELNYRLTLQHPSYSDQASERFGIMAERELSGGDLLLGAETHAPRA